MSQFATLRLYLNAHPHAHPGWAALQVRLAMEDITVEDHALKLAWLRRWVTFAYPHDRDTFHSGTGWWRLTRRGQIVAGDILEPERRAAA